MAEAENEYDLFLSYSHADSEAIVETLVEELEAYSLDVWYDKMQVKIGDSITESIDEGLRKSNFGIVVLSEEYFDGTSQWELNGLVTRHNREDSVILPLWYGIGHDFVVEQSASLADLRAETLTNENVQDVATDLYHAVERGRDEVDERNEDSSVNTPSFTDIQIKFQEHFNTEIGKKITIKEWRNHNPPSVSSLEAVKIRDEERGLTVTSNSRGTMMTVKRIDEKPLNGRITNIETISSGETKFTIRVKESRINELPKDRDFYKSGLV